MLRFCSRGPRNAARSVTSLLLSAPHTDTRIVCAAECVSCAVCAQRGWRVHQKKSKLAWVVVDVNCGTYVDRGRSDGHCTVSVSSSIPSTQRNLHDPACVSCLHRREGNTATVSFRYFSFSATLLGGAVSLNCVPTGITMSETPSTDRPSRLPMDRTSASSE